MLAVAAHMVVMEELEVVVMVVTLIFVGHLKHGLLDLQTPAAVEEEQETFVPKVDQETLLLVTEPHRQVVEDLVLLYSESQAYVKQDLVLV